MGVVVNMILLNQRLVQVMEHHSGFGMVMNVVHVTLVFSPNLYVDVVARVTIGTAKPDSCTGIMVDGIALDDNVQILNITQ